MPATFVTAQSAGSSGFAASPLTLSGVPCGTDPNTVVIGWLRGESSAANSIANMAVDGDTSGTTAQAQILIGSESRFRLFVWVGTGPGTVPIAFSWTGDISASQGGVLVYSGASGIANYASATLGSSTTTPAVTVSSAVGDLALALWTHGQTSANATASGTERFDAANGIIKTFVFEEPGAASVSVDGTTDTAIFYDVRVAFSLQSVVSAPVITGPSGAAGAGSSTANIAENASTGPTFTTDIALGGGYPTLTGAQAANWAITALSSTSWRIDPVTPFNFEAGGLVNPQAFTFNASASVSKSCAVTVTDASEPPLAPTIGTATAGNASASVAFTAPSNTGRPAISGYTATSSPGGLTGTGATSPITVSGLTNGTAYTFTVTATNADGTGLASAASNSVTPSAGDVTPPTMSAASVTGGTLSATGSITASEVGTLWWKMDGSATAADPGPGSEVGAGWTSQSMLAAANSVNFSTQPAGLRYGHFLGIDAAGNRAAVVNASGTVNGASLAGFDFHTAVGCVFGSVSGSLVSLGRETAGRQINVYAKTVGTDTTVAYSAALTLDSNGRLPRWTHASLVLGTQYDLFFCPVDGGKPGVRRMAAT